MSIETYQEHGNGVAHYQPQGASLAVRPRTVQRLVEWAEAAQAAYTVAEKLVKTSFVPKQFRDKPHEATAAILAGDELGFSPMAALNAFDVIEGSAAPKALTQRAVVQSRGHAVWLVEANDTRAIMRGRRKGEEEFHESEWTIERARKLKLLSKDNWQKQPKAMLIARATSEVCRLTAADALLGIPYSSEELIDGVVAGWTPVPAPAATPELESTPAKPTTRTAQRRTKPQAPAQATPPPAEQEPAEPEGPPLPGEDGYEVEQEQPPAPMISKPQRDKIMALFGEGGLRGQENREARLAVSRIIVGRDDLTSSNELTRDEASRLIDHLDEMSKQEDGLALAIAELLERSESGGQS